MRPDFGNERVVELCPPRCTKPQEGFYAHVPLDLPLSAPAFIGRCAMSLPIQNLINERCRDLGLSRSELVVRCGYKNISKGIRRLDEVYEGDLEKAVSLLLGLPKALELSPDIVQQAFDETIRQIAAEADARYRASFSPCAYLLGTSDRPSQIFNFGLTGGADRWLKIPLDLSQPPESYAEQALSVVRKTPVVEFFGATTGFIVNYTPDHAVRFAPKPRRGFAYNNLRIPDACCTHANLARHLDWVNSKRHASASPVWLFAGIWWSLTIGFRVARSSVAPAISSFFPSALTQSRATVSGDESVSGVSGGPNPYGALSR
jgi:hypothetical protein